MAEQDSSAAAGKVSFNVTASVRYPDAAGTMLTPAEHLDALRKAGNDAAVAYMDTLNGRIESIAVAIRDGAHPGEWVACDVEPGVGAVLTHADGKQYNVTVMEAF